MNIKKNLTLRKRIARVFIENNLEILSTREIRDKLLAESDWTQSRDVTLSNDSDWKTYRQALRDITKTANPKLATEGPITLDLSSVIFPEKPS